MKILHIETRHRQGGAERNVLHTAAYQVAAGHAVHLAVGRDSDVNGLPNDLHVHVIPSLVRAIDPVRDLAALRELRSLIRGHRFDIVHTHQSKAGVIGRVAARGIAPVTVHTVHMASFGPAYNRLASSFFLQAEQVCARFTDVIVTVGSELRDVYLEEHVGRPDQYRVIHSPIDVEGLVGLRQLDDHEVARIRRDFGLGDLPLAVSIGSLERRKRFDVVVRELADLLRAGRLHLAIAGDGPEREPLRQLTRELGVDEQVSLLGHVPDVGPLLRASNVLVHASKVEGVPQVIIQALAVGTPVVATEAIGLHEVTSDALVVVPTSGRMLAGAVESVLASTPPAPLPDDLSSWSRPAVEDELAKLMGHLDDRLVARRQRGRP